MSKLEHLYAFQTDLVVIDVIGAKAAAFLHGQLTNSIQDLKLHYGNYNLLLTNKGKIQADGFVVRSEQDRLKIFCDSKYQDVLLEHLKKLAPLSRVELNVVKDKVAYHVFGEALAGMPALEKNGYRRHEFNGMEAELFRSDRLRVPGYDVWVEKAEEDTLKAYLNEHHYELLSEDGVEFFRVKFGVPKLGKDITEKNLPQEAGLYQALHFQKGCYLGQEVIARLHYRGHVNKLLVHFQAGSKLAEADDILNQDQKKVGEIASSVFDAKENKSYALGYISYKSNEDQDHFFVKGTELKRLR